MGRELELLNGIALLITAASLALMSLFALPVSGEPRDCRTGTAAAATFEGCRPVQR